MELEEAKKLLKEMQENCKNKTIYKDEKAEAKAEAIEVVLKEVEEREKRYWKREERFLDMYNREKHEEIYNDLLDERDKNYIPKDKIGEKLLVITDLKSKIDLSKEKTPLEFYVLDYANNLLVELLEEE